MKNNETPAAALSARAPYHCKHALLGLALTASLFAQESEELPVYELKDIIVTGELWESELQRTTASISVLDEATLQNNGTQHFEDVINSIPNLTWTGGTSRPRYIQIRGIGENSQFEGETPDSSVRFLMDDFDLTGVGTVGNLFDVQQVEVLRGPQAGAFGANAAGGVIKIVSNEPTSTWTGQSEATFGNDELYAFGVAVGGPILENDPEQLTFRFSINSLNQNGFRENQFLNRDNTNERDELTSRLKVRWLPNNNWSFETGFLYADADNGYDEFTLNNEDEDTYSDEPGRDEQETRGASLKAKFTSLDKAELTYTGQFTDTDSLYSYDSDWGAGNLDPAILGTVFESGYFGFLKVLRDREVFSHELRIDSKDRVDALGWIDRWTLGIYHHQLDEFSDVDYRDEFGLGAATSQYETSSTAIFGQASQAFNDRTRIILGLRAESTRSISVQTSPRITLDRLLPDALNRARTITSGAGKSPWSMISIRPTRSSPASPGATKQAGPTAELSACLATRKPTTQKRSGTMKLDCAVNGLAVSLNHS